MHRSIPTAPLALRQDVAGRLDAGEIHAICSRLGHNWRACRLTPAAIIHWFLLQVLSGNTALQHISLLAGRAFTDGAYCQARARLPLAVYKALVRHLAGALLPDTRSDGLWHGHRTLLVDGSSSSMADEPPLRARFGRPPGQAQGCGFPVAKILAAFHAGTGMLLEVIAAPLRTHEMARVGDIHTILEPGDVLVGDCGFCSFAHLALLAGRGCHAVFREHQRQIVDFAPRRPMAPRSGGAGAAGRPRSRWLRRLGASDQVVAWIKPAGRPGWMPAEAFAALPARLELRELRYDIGNPGFRTRRVTLVTTLLDEGAYPAEDLAELYGVRWRVDLYLRDLKQSMNMDVLNFKTVECVLKELSVYAMAYNLVRLVMNEVSKRQGVACDRISFVDALRWLRDVAPGTGLPALVVNPHRPGRFEPRVRKRRPKQYPLMTRPRRELKQALIAQSVGA